MVLGVTKNGWKPFLHAARDAVPLRPVGDPLWEPLPATGRLAQPHPRMIRRVGLRQHHKRRVVRTGPGLAGPVRWVGGVVVGVVGNERAAVQVGGENEGDGARPGHHGFRFRFLSGVWHVVWIPIRSDKEGDTGSFLTIFCLGIGTGTLWYKPPYKNFLMQTHS